MFVLGVREGTFLMSEKFRIDGPFGYRAAVDGEIRTMLASREGMNDFREMLLAHTGLSGDEHAQIGTRYLHGDFNIPIQKRVLANDAEPLFDG